MAGRALIGSTVKPEEVTNIDSWLQYYRQKRANIQMGDDGSLLVLDPALLKTPAEAYARPAKIIPHLRGNDATIVLATSTNPELRATAEAKQKTITEAIRKKVASKSKVYTSTEHELLSAVDEWKIADSAATRSAAALHIGNLSRELADADEDVRSALYPHRRVVAEWGIPKKYINYATHDDGNLPYKMYLTVLDTTTPEDRVLPIVADKP